MANDVEIIVEASVADALVKLDLVKHAVKDVGDAGGVTSRQIGDETNRGSLVSSMGRLEQHLFNFNGSGRGGLGTLETGLARVGGNILRLTNGFAEGATVVGQWIASIGQDVPVLGEITTALGGVVAGFGGLVAILGPVGAVTGIAAAAFFLLDTAVNALATTVGTVIAIFADLVAPVTLVTGLLGLLGAGFLLAAKSAFGPGGALGGQVEVLKHQFDNLTKTLVNDFMPVFRFLIDNAHSALTYLNQIAKLPLADAFRSLATTGVQAVSKFLGQVGSLLARPFRLAVQIAFGSGKGGNEVASAVAGLWKQFSDFLFGYTKTHPVRVGGKFLGITQTQVEGALQPFIDWFHRHHFEEQGRQIGRQILVGLAPLAKPLGQFFVQVLEDSAKQSARDFATIFVSILHVRLWPVIAREAATAGHAIERVFRSAASSIASTIVNLLSAAWNRVSALAESVWRRIGSVGRAAVLTLIAVVAGPLVGAWSGVMGAVRAVTSLIHGAVGAVQGLISALQGALSIAQSVASAVSLGSSSSTAGRTGMGGNSPGNPGGHVVMPSGTRLGGSVVVVNHFHSVDLTTAAQRRRVAATMGDEVVRRFQQQAGG